MKLTGVDQDLASAYQMIANARGAKYISSDVLNTKDLAANTQNAIDGLVKDIKVNVEIVTDISNVEEKKKNQNVVANDYVIVNPTPTNEAKNSAEYNRGFAMGVKSSFITSGSVVAAGYLIKGAETLYKKVRDKDEKNEIPKVGNTVVVQQQVQQPQQVIQTQQQIINNTIQ